MKDDTLTEVPLEPHMVDILLVMDVAIEIPGCVGVVPVFINKESADKYVGDGPVHYAIEPRKITQHKWKDSQ